MKDLYLGLDVHSESCTCAVMGPSGKRLKVVVLRTNAKELATFVKSLRGRRHLCFEEGGQSAWLHEVLNPHVDELVVTVPKKRKGRAKSDAADAWARADELRRGTVEVSVFKAPLHFTKLREAARGHEVIVRDMVRAKNRLRSVFRARGLMGLGDKLLDPDDRQSCLKKLPARNRYLAELYGQEVDALLLLRATAEDRLLKEAKKHAIVKRLATAPGLGPIRAAQVVAVIVTPHRFRTRAQLYSYCGLAVVTHSSSDWTQRDGQWIWDAVPQTRGLNRNRNPTLKHVFKGAALTVTRMKKHPLKDDYQRLLAAGTRPPLAKLTIARRIASTVWAMWKNNEEYDQTKHRTRNQSRA